MHYKMCIDPSLRSPRHTTNGQYKRSKEEKKNEKNIKHEQEKRAVTQ